MALGRLLVFDPFVFTKTCIYLILIEAYSLLLPPLMPVEANNRFRYRLTIQTVK